MSKQYDVLTGPFPSAAAEDKLREDLKTAHFKNREMRAKVDAAGTDAFSQRLYSGADSLGPNAAFSEGVRQRVRDRGRYENLNNGTARGLSRSHSNDLIGTCPRPQLTIPGDPDGLIAEQIEASFGKWAKAIQMGHKARLMEKQACHSNEAFCILQDNERVNHPVKLDWRLIECDQCLSPYGMQTDPYLIDGVRIDELGNKLVYYFLKYHPNELRGIGLMNAGEFITVSADKVLHWFEADRPGQLRGLAKLASALPIFAQVRRWDAAALTAAEFAAMLAGVMKTNLPTQSGSATQIDDWSFFEMVKGALLTIPQGWDATQFDPKQPTANHGEFKRGLHNDAGWGSGAPLNVTTGNSSQYNYSSGRLDFVPYHRSKRIDRYDFQNVVLDPTFVRWETYARFAGEIPEGTVPLDQWTWSWNFDGFEGIDAQKDANTDDVRIRNGTATYAEIFGEYGQDSREQLKKLAAEVRAFKAEGLIHPFVAEQMAAAPSPQAGQNPNNPPVDPNAQARLMSALSEHGIDESMAELIAASFFMPHRPAAKPSRNGFHKHPVGGRL